MGYGQKSAIGFGWMFTSNASVQVIRMATNMVLARLLVPDDFGAVALVLAFIAILQTFADLGMSVALVQREKLTNLVIDSAFVASGFLTVFIVVAIWFSSGYIANFFEMPILSGLFKITAFAYIFKGMFSFYRCLLLRELRYKAISAITFSAFFIGGAVSIILAYLGHGAYSIVWGNLITAVVHLLVGVCIVKYVPGSFGNFEEMRRLFSFGMWVSLGRIMGQSAGKVDTFVIGKIVNAAALGGYYLAQKIVLLIPSTYSRIIDQVMLPIYSKFQNEIDRVHDSYFKALSATTIILLPSACFVFLFADPLVRVFLGDQWLNVIPLVMIMSLYGVMRSLGGGVFAAIIFSLGKPKVATFANAVRMISLPGCVLVGSFWGVTGVAWGFGFYGILGRVFNQWLLKHFFGFSLTRYVKVIFPASFSAAVATIPSFLICHYLVPGSVLNMIIWNMVAMIVWVVIYFVLIRLLAKKDLEYMWRISKPIFQKIFSKVMGKKKVS
jgi:O-antigen/teichoic acid export membrane protein